MFTLSNQEPLRNPDKGPLGVVLSTGEFQITVTDFEIPGRGFPFRLARTYRSKSDGQTSLLGYNWSLSLDEYLTPGTWWDPEPGHPSTQCEAVQWQMGNGFSDTWVNTCNPFHIQEWKAFLGFFGQIRFLGAGLGYQIRYPDGTVKTYAQDGRNALNQVIWILTSVEDRNGNVMTIKHDGTKRGIDWITDTLGRKIRFQYDANHRLTSVTDFNNRSVVYSYDVRGDLVSVRSPIVRASTGGIDDAFPSGKTTIYHYLGADNCGDTLLLHNIKSITDGSGHIFLTNNYLAATDPDCGTVGAPVDAVASQVYGGGTPPPTISYVYDLVSSGQIAPNVVASKTSVTDRSGSLQVHSFNGQGNPLSVEYQTNRGVRTGEIDYAENFAYVDYGGGNQPMLVSQHSQSGGTNVDGSGNLVPYSTGMSETMVYDQSGAVFQGGNLVSVHRTPGPRGAPAGQSDISITYTYEPLFNQPLTITDSGGHVTTFTYDFQEGTYAQLIAGNPAPVDSAWWTNNAIIGFMDQANGYSQMGELNGDGYHRGGNLIKVYEGVTKDFAGMPASPGPADEIASYTAYNSFGLPTRSRDAEYNETVFRYFAENDPDGDLTVTPAPADGRSLSAVSGESGGGFLKEKVLDATPTMPLPAGIAPNPRESGQNPPALNILLSFAYDPVGNVKQATDGRGVRTDYTVNELNQIVQIAHAASATHESPAAPAFSYLEQFRFDANNNVIKHRSERRDDGSFTSPAPMRWVTKDTLYDGLDRKISETISTDDVPVISLTTSYAYDANGNLRKTIFPGGNAVLRFYDERDLLYREVVLKNASTDPAVMTYDSAIDSVTEYDYDGSGNVIQLTDPEGHKARTGYDGYDRKVVGFDPAFQKSTFSYDRRGDVIEQASFGALGGPTPTPATPPVSEYPMLSHQIHYYDELGRLRRSDAQFFKYMGTTLTPLATDSNAQLTTTPAGEPIPAEHDGWVTSLIGYDRLGRVVRSVDDNGHAAETRYDGLGRKLKVLMNVAAPFSPDGGNPLNNRNAMDYTYDPNGNVTEILETEYGADRTGASPRLLPAQQHRSAFTYDSMNRQIEAKLVGRVGAPVLNLTTKTVYDSRGNKIQVTDPAGGRAKSSFDGLNRLTKTEAGYFWNGATENVPANMINTANPDGKVTTTYGYDANSRLTSIKDDNNRITSFLYDNLNRQTRITYPDGTYRELTYDKDSLSTSWAHYSGTGYVMVASTQYDWLHRPKQKDIYNSQAPWVIGTQRQSFEYDGLGRITLAQDDANTADGFVDSEVALAYNSMGKVLSEAQTWRDNSSGQLLTGTHTVTSVYNGVGFRTSVSYPGDRTVSYLPDELNRPESIVDSYTGTIQYDFLGGGRFLNRIYPNGTKLTMLSSATDNVGAGYDNARRLVDFASKLNATGAALAEFTYGYDKAGNRTFERRVHEISGASWKGETYGYDAVYRLINRKEGNLNSSGVLQGAAGTTQDFTLDGAGNWKTHKKNTSTYNQTINSLNQYTVFNGPLGQRTLNYDFLGNLTNESLASGDQQYSYDFLNRLVMCMDLGGNLIKYRYDALGRRISKNLNGWTHTRYVYDGDRLIQERNGTSPGNLVASYVYGMGSEEVLARRRWQGGTPSDIFYHTNALGSVSAVTNETGIVVERYKYDAYGQVTFLSPTFTPLTSSAVSNNVLFTGRYYDTETKLYYYRARTYHPYLGRFLQRDPLGEAASLNLYNYVFNNPVNDTDPSGMLSGQMAEWYNDGGSAASARAWSQREAQDQESMRKANERFFGHDDRTSSWNETVGAMDKAHWEKRAADKQARRDQELQRQIQTSLFESKMAHNAMGISAPVGVAVIVYGLNQKIGDKANKTDLDKRADDLRSSGYVVIEVQADTLAKVGNASEPSSTGLGILEQAVAKVAANGPAGSPIEITGFSRGGGGAVQLTNALTGSGISGSRISVDLVDPYMGANSHQIDNPWVSVTVEASRGFHITNALVINPGAVLMGLHNRDLSQRISTGAFQNTSPVTFNLSHTRMDSCVSAGGALSGC